MRPSAKSALALALALLCANLHAAELPLLDFEAGFDAGRQLVSNGAQGSVVAAPEGGNALRVEADPTMGKWPGVAIRPPAGTWDLGAYGGVACDVRNVGETACRFGLRVDNPGADGSKNCNTEATSIGPGQQKTIRVVFGQSWGGPGFALAATNVTALLVFFDQPKGPVALLVDNVRAVEVVAPGGKAPPTGPGVLIDFEAGFNPGTQLGESGGKPTLAAASDGKGRALRIEAGPADGRWPGVSIYPAAGKWNLVGCNAISFDLENPGDKPVGIGLRVDNPGADGRRNCNAETLRLAPGEKKTATVTFGKSYGSPAFILDTASIVGVLVFIADPKQADAVLVDNIRALPGIAPKAFELQTPRERVELGFEPGAEEALYGLNGGEVTADAAQVIAGKASLLGDSAGKLRDWFEFATTAAGLLAGNYNYTYSFRYRVLRATPDAYAYVLFRSHAKGWGKTDRGWTNINALAGQAGETRTFEGKVALGAYNDYTLMFGIHGEAAIVIDDVRIVRGEPFVDTAEADRLAAFMPAGAEPVLKLDFEQDAPATAFRTPGGPVYAGAPDAIAGARALVLDSLKSGSEWNELLSFGQGQLVPGFRYYLTARIRMVERQGGHVYFFARAGGSPNRGWRDLRYTTGELGAFTTTLDVRDGDPAGYALVFGLQGKARAVVDDIDLRRTPLPASRIKDRVPLDPAQAQLVFEENFDGTELDTTKWTRSGDSKRHGGFWLREDANLDGKGNLDLRFKKKDGVYTMGAINTDGKFEFAYGRVEARMQCPTQEGHWPGIWLFAGSVNRVGDEGRDGTEIDIVEAPWRKKDDVSHALHWDGYGDDHKSEGKVVSVPGVNAGWHTYALDWSPDGYIFFVDGRETWRTDAGGVCTNKLHIILSDEMGGWSGNPDNATSLPDHTLIDYVRVWQTK